MRDILLFCQNTEARNGLSLEDKPGSEMCALTDSGPEED
jgi:hypothetical protein